MSITAVKQRRKRGQKALSKDQCEICKQEGTKIHIHHIIPQCDPRCSQDNWNRAAICPNCHAAVHDGKITIVGVYRSTSGRLLKFYHGDTPPDNFLEREYWLIKPEDNVMVTSVAAKKKTG
jgi:ribosomal protein L32